MFFKILWNYLRGYVRIKVEGYFIERFINICTAKGILLWNSKRENSSILHTNLGISDFKKVKQVVNKTKCKIKIEKKDGLPFFLHKYKKRKLFAVLLLLMVLGMFLLSNFIWNIEIQGIEKIDSSTILDSVKQNGLTIGKWKGKVDTKKIINDIRLNRSDLAWVGIELKGTNAIVKVVEAQEKPELVPENEYCNIVSDKEGKIEKIDAANGTALVKQGDVVKQGTPLIGGWMEGKYTGVRYVHASGEVQAKVWYTNRQKIELSQVLREKTGKEEKKYRIEIQNFKINLYKKLSNFEKCDTIETKKNLKLFSDFYLPVSVVTCHNFEIEEKPIKYTYEQAKQIAIEKAREELAKQIGELTKVQDEIINVKEQDGWVEVEVIYEVLEKIGTKEKIIF